ncbi:MAG: murein biosynthesis integral membrane protein MurJ [Acidimicrobiales bacterium]
MSDGAAGAESPAPGPAGPGRGAPPADPDLGRHTAQITVGNLASRITGLMRVMAVAAALGTTFLGNTYQTANLVSNIVFELLAAGLLSSVLVPTFVRLVDARRGDEAEEVAGALLGLALVVLGAVTVAAMVARTWIMRGLTVAVDDPLVRAQEVRLGSFLLLVFLPQTLLYAVGAVVTALLHGSRRFAAAAFAPVANNVVVVVTMAVFWAIGGGESHGTGGLTVGGPERLVLAVGTTAGVAAMTLVAVLGAWRAGFALRPRWNPAHAGLRTLGRAGLWGIAYLALNQALVAITLVLANQVEGGVVAYQIAFTVFLLPFAVGAHPTLTAVYPRLVTEAAARRWGEFAERLSGATATIVFLVAPAAALLVALGRPALGVVAFGQLDAAGATLVARVLAGYGIGLLGYACFQLFTRASYASGDMRAPALVNGAMAAAGSALMMVAFALASGGTRVVVLGLAYSAVTVAGAVGLAVIVGHQVGHSCIDLGSLGRGLVCGVAAGVTARLVADRIAGGGRVADALAVVVATTAAVAVYIGGQWGLGAPELRRRLESN